MTKTVPAGLTGKLTKSRESGVVNVRRRQQRAVDTRERILEAAFGEFAARGFEGASTRSIAALAGVRHPLVQHHFESKEGLWKAVVSTVQQNFDEYFGRYLHGETLVDEVEQLRRLQEAFARFAAAYPNYHWLMAHEGRAPSQLLTWLIDTSVKTYFNEIARLIRAAQARGRYVAGDPHHLQFLFIGAVTRIFMQKAEAESTLGRSLESQAFVESHVRLCCDLFFREPAAAASPTARRARPPAAARPSAKPRGRGTR
ncbi:MAG TPA: TetR/AcrR family transcriptional regulator [Burkholderiaceae bacterium]|nr:TetR/AcrR family transcriptional regulator [Burkholderiaceae bacterium]